MQAYYLAIALFASKCLIGLLVLAAILGIILFIFANKSHQRETLSIENLNEKFDNLRDMMEEETHDKASLKLLNKLRKKAAKSLSDEVPSKLFVTRFEGDVHASEVENLRECITAILSVAKPSDEVLVILESSGGLVHQYGLGAAQLERIRQKGIHLTVAVDLVAASGGYLMAAVANKILAAPFAVLGSIGVIAQLPNFNRLLNKFDVDIEHHTAGKYKSTLTMLGHNTPAARKKFQAELDDTHQLFKDFVAAKRPELDIDSVASGEHWYGSQALALKLIDAVGTSDEYILQKSETMDLYEVAYTINVSFKEKLSQKLGLVAIKTLNFIQKTCISASQFK